MGQLKYGSGSDWSSVTMHQSETGLIVSEKLERFKIEAASELVLRLVGGLLVALSTLLWVVLPMGLAGDQLASHAMLAAIFTAVGLGVYAYGSRGFRRQVSFDGARRVLSLTKININQQNRVARSFGFDEIESVYVRRPTKRSGFASLLVRVAGTKNPVLALTGEQSELEQVHDVLCDLVHGTERRVARAPLRKRQRLGGFSAIRA
ncbi:MAG: hypothetical protein AAFR49_03750 [Pseudomonadota bacterium]